VQLNKEPDRTIPPSPYDII